MEGLARQEIGELVLKFTLEVVNKWKLSLALILILAPIIGSQLHILSLVQGSIEVEITGLGLEIGDELSNGLWITLYMVLGWLCDRGNWIKWTSDKDWDLESDSCELNFIEDNIRRDVHLLVTGSKQL